MFTWIPIHEEIVPLLLTYRDRSPELVDILYRMQAAGLKPTSVRDKLSDGSRTTLKEIDPFTFLANFNRGLRDENRQALWQFLKVEWNLKSDVPDDFQGVPLANLQSSWLMPYELKRTADHTEILWDFYEHILTVAPEELDTALMDRALGLRRVAMTILTMGMFWARPDTWLSTDGKNIDYAETKGVLGKPKNGTEYLAWLKKVRQTIAADGVEFSRQAHLASLVGKVATDGYGSPFNYIFPGNQADRALDYFANVLEVLRQEVEEPEGILVVTVRRRTAGMFLMRINIGMWAVTAIKAKANQRNIEVALPLDHPESEGKGISDCFSEKIGGKSYVLVDFAEEDFFARYDELWPEIKAGVAAISQHFAGRNSPFMRFHRPELVELITEPAKRSTILKAGLSLKGTGPELDPSDKERRYWLIAPGEGAKYWEQWLDENIASIGWSQVGDLGQYESKEAAIGALEQVFTDVNQSGAALMLWNFSHVMKDGDVVFVKLGRSEVIGWGIVRGSYYYDEGHGDFPNLLPVEWMEKKAAKLPEGRMLAMKSLTEIDQNDDLLQTLSAPYEGIPGVSTPGTGDDPPGKTGPDAPEPYSLEQALKELFIAKPTLEHILEQLKRKKNIILQGAPGVGKTFIAKRLAYLQMGVKDESVVEMVQFHQSYTYEDFVQGLRPTKEGHFAVKDGAFYRLCRRALANPDQDFFLVIDEINRGNLSKILGELMMLIETDKRGQGLTLAYSEDSFTVPPNLYLIGTMNTADRSLSLVDYALRRRFAFLTLTPGFETTSFQEHLTFHGLTGDQIRHIRSHMSALNQAIEEDDGNLGPGYRIGHSFFTPTAKVENFEKWFSSIARYEIIPLLEEYWVDDPSAVKRFRMTLLEEQA